MQLTSKLPLIPLLLLSLSLTPTILCSTRDYPSQQVTMPVPVDLPKMEYRFLGNSGLKVSAVGLGGWTTFGGDVEDEETYEIMKAAYEAGVNFFDTAEQYSEGRSEIVMGKAIKKYGWKRNDLVISTKIYWGTAFGDNPVNNVGLSRKHIIEGVNQSLARLQLDYVDLIFAHRPDRDTPMEETVRAFNHIINTGKAFYWGTSEWDADEIASAWRVAERLGLIGPVMEQSWYNVIHRDRVESEYVHLYKEYGTGLTVWSPLEQGLLTGRYDDCDHIPDGSRLKEGMTEEEFQHDIKLVRLLKPIAERLGISQATLALAWILKNKRVSSIIMGASRVEQIHQNVRVFSAVEKMTPDVMDEIDRVLGNKPPGKVGRAAYED